MIGPNASRGLRLSLAVVAACLTATGLYGVLRVIQAILFREADPALVIWSPHAGYFWRILIVGYVGGMVGFGTWILAAREPARVARFLSNAVFVVTALLVAQALFVP
ncbi:hypothetical protein AKJ09_07838 [Labilithrix luteola]|uniref:Integral membrane protein n=1 Tax=Labilithrix luteola TaxID=1391654 RepID=A0A0K1Q6Z5_9BACT|nr:hypothetical protein [Labilithrix luteola]AKV01175.1 hypothetical protein AKJ09_07838 [Labilithrix luteola]